MNFTQNALLLLLLFWILQIAGAWVQWSHYRRALGDAAARWSDGFLGMGQSRPRFGAGAIAMLEVDPELRVRRLQTLRGLSVFARFQTDTSVRGWTLDQLGRQHAAGPRDTALARAVRQAISQVEEVRSRQK